MFLIQRRCLAKAKRIFTDASQAARAVMVGAAYSVACYDSIRGNQLSQQCPFCQGAYVPNWEHLVWRCAFFSQARLLGLTGVWHPG